MKRLPLDSPSATIRPERAREVSRLVTASGGGGNLTSRVTELCFFGSDMGPQCDSAAPAPGRRFFCALQPYQQSGLRGCKKVAGKSGMSCISPRPTGIPGREAVEFARFSHQPQAHGHPSLPGGHSAAGAVANKAASPSRSSVELSPLIASSVNHSAMANPSRVANLVISARCSAGLLPWVRPDIRM